MKSLPLFYGYAGTLPFLAFAGLGFFTESYGDAEVLGILQMVYGAMIFSFLGGIHWAIGVPAENMKQITFSMVPTIYAFLLIIWTFLVDPILPLALLAVGFWALFWADTRFIAPDYFPENYRSFRRNLTLIVSFALIVSAGLLWFISAVTHYIM